MFYAYCYYCYYYCCCCCYYCCCCCYYYYYYYFYYYYRSRRQICQDQQCIWNCTQRLFDSEQFLVRRLQVAPTRDGSEKMNNF